MVVTHRIPTDRLQIDYLTDLMRCVGLSRFYIRLLGSSSVERVFKLPAYVVNDLRKLLLHWLRYGLNTSQLGVVLTCERTLLTSTLASPAFLLKKASTDRWLSWRGQTELRQRWLQQLTTAFENDGARSAIAQRLHRLAIYPLDSGAQPLADIWLTLEPHAPPNPLAEVWPLAQRYGLGRTLERRLLLWTCRLLEQAGSAPIHCLRLSPDCIIDGALLTFLDEQQRLYPQACGRLWLELPSSCLAQSVAAGAWLQRVSAMGFGVGIGNLNVGDTRWQQLSPLRYLRLAPARDLRTPELKSLVHAAAARDVGILATAVDTPELAAWLSTTGVTWGMGKALGQVHSWQSCDLEEVYDGSS